MNIEQIARVCYEADRAALHTMDGEKRLESWDETSQSSRDAGVNGIKFVLGNLDKLAAFDAQLKDVMERGWAEPSESAPDERLRAYLYRAILCAFLMAEKA